MEVGFKGVSKGLGKKLHLLKHLNTVQQRLCLWMFVSAGLVLFCFCFSLFVPYQGSLNR